MKYLYLILSCMILTHLTSCEKENNDENSGCIDPQLPGEYFPAYPKSWWSYYNANNELVEYKISDNYQECEGKCRPLFENIDKCIQGNALIHRFYAGLGTSSTVNSPIYSTTIDSVLVCPISFSTFEEQNNIISINDVRYRRKATAIDTSITIDGTLFDDVLIVYEYDKFDSTHRYFDYFAKNIGLIKRDSVNQNDTTDLIQILKLNSYYIGN